MSNILLLLGTIIGAGIFSLSAALKEAGALYFVGLLFCLSYLLGNINWYYHQIIESVKSKHQLPGYVQIILGKKAATLATCLLLFSTLGALLAYLIIGGTFMANALGVPANTGSMIFYAVVFSLVLLTGKKLLALDNIFVAIKIFLLVFIIMIGFVNKTWLYDTVPLIGHYPWAVYGAILFSLTGFSIIPELKKDSHVLKSISISQGLVAVLYLLFAVSLYPFLSSGTVLIHNIWFDITGVFAILTPYLMLTLVGYDLLTKDLHISKRVSQFFMLLIPFVLFALGFQSFIQVISFTGGVFFGGIALLITRMYQKRFPGKHSVIVSLIQIVFGLGILVEFWQFFSI